ncbi:hypothetical protein scyTo_0010948 [Scyliorhinus torazame]|uniref:Uncharacterized protein n=1 Tax=Scyliorhinus torazame TaxID=75743 RepID=A0A401PDK0_SCYTO|nr:hypothetical protein [Scyliorhinus torazame]
MLNSIVSTDRHRIVEICRYSPDHYCQYLQWECDVTDLQKARWWTVSVKCAQFLVIQSERVLCFHGPLLYEAKCVKVAIKDKQVKYFIHYSGWNKNLGVWYLQDYREQWAEGKMRGAAPAKKASTMQQKNVEIKTKKNKQKAPTAGDGSSTSETPQPPRKKRARVDPTMESEETFMNRVEVKVKIPEELKPWLVDDWDLITRQKQLFHLPAKKNVDTVLEEYANYKKSRGNTDNNKEYAVNEVAITGWFLLRIGAMLAYTPLDEKSLALLLNYLHDFLKYLVKNASSLFSPSDYEVAPPEYHRKAV